MRLVLSIVVFAIILSITYGAVNTNSDWLPVQQIAKSYDNINSIDENYNGIVDVAESLNGFTDKDFIKTNGGILKGTIYLYYGLGKIVDMDNLNYYVDPSSSSKFYSLCLGDGCIKRWADISSIVSQNNVNISPLTQWCVEGDCNNGIDAMSLEGHRIGSGEGDIPVISPVIYYNLKVGYAEVASKIGNLTDNNIQPLLNSKCPANHSVVGFDKGVIICEPINQPIDINSEDLAILNTSLTSYINDKIQNIESEILAVNNTLSNKDDDLLKEINYIRLSINNLSNIYVQKIDLDRLEIALKTYTDNKISALKLSNKVCSNGVIKGFDGSQNLQCISYSLLASNIKPSLDSYFVNQEDFKKVENSLKSYIDTKISSILSNKRCYGGVLLGFDSSNKPICKSYNDLSSAISLYMKEDLQLSLDLRYVKQTDINTILSSYLQKSSIPRCNNGEVLTNKQGILQCIKIPKPIITLNDVEHTYDTEYDEEGTFTLKCPSGYVMTGIKIKREEEKGWTGGEKFVRKIDVICRKFTIS